MMKEVTSLKLGGIGPNIGSEDWKYHHEKLDRRQKYSDTLRERNASLSP
jgi:hypothetical protein